MSMTGYIGAVDPRDVQTVLCRVFDSMVNALNVLRVAGGTLEGSQDPRDVKTVLTRVYDSANQALRVTMINGESVALTYTDPLEVDMSLASQFTVTATTAVGNTTINATGVAIASLEVTFILTGDATGGRVVTFGANFDATDTLILSANDQSVIKFMSDGIAWREVCRSPNVPVYIWK